ncbi:translation initiation factor 2 [Pseudomonas lalucatii]|uniref:Translation initiation factor 2 n=1 Tax=Pseudomonas lalucatii TaxID=1424203 RepID=A0ABS5PWV6_9PSED|nr:translation initiation factor 2 [Pseudomonas lalucatii]MBS7660970.1 translation initiation factor 2 [Pseudomonas lalucatii]MBS7691529.1 translation initiation factor 2 [Pseudomonas lalucatii]MBS7724356.1 translation initiation factor 2 [Pseudomonas lalucatii]QVM87656.1 translation initiation factor 2 [Pseudomonas lalucatii]
MRPAFKPLLFALWLLPLHLQAAEDTAPALPEPSAAQTQLRELEQRLAASERQRAALSAELQAGSGERESAQVQRLRQENQRLKLQLKRTQAESPARLLSDQQTWFAIGAGAGLLGVIIGALLRGNRRTRREWIN